MKKTFEYWNQPTEKEIIREAKLNNEGDMFIKAYFDKHIKSSTANIAEYLDNETIEKDYTTIKK